MQKNPLIAQTVLRDSHPPGVRVGCDVITEDRITQAMARRGPTFAQLLFQPAELVEHASSTGALSESLEARFALKESVLKALGRGLSGSLNLKHVQTTQDAVELAGPAADLAGDVRIETHIARNGAHIMSCVWLIPERQDCP